MHLYFHTDREIPEAQLLKMIQEVVPVSGSVLKKNPEKKEGKQPDKNKLHITQQTGKGQFSFYFELQTYLDSKALAFKDKIELLQKLAAAAQVNILVGDESVNPYVFIHIDTQGQTGTVGVETSPYNDNDELTIEEVYNHSFGSFATETPLRDEEVKVLKEVLRGVVPDYQLMHLEDGPVAVSFGMYKDQFDQLRNFTHYYFVLPLGRNKWYSKDEKSELFTSMMLSFYAQTKRKLCFFTANSEEVKNIPGGSDSEAFCIYVDEQGAEKIIYKKRRDSWLK